MNFKIGQQKAVLKNLNLRDELHGDEHHTAADLSLLLTIPNTWLDMFHGKLLPFLYQKAEGDSQEDLTGHLPELRFPGLAQPIGWDETIVGGTVTVHHGIGDDSNIVLSLAGIDKFRFHCKQGGSVDLALRVQCNPEPEQIAGLSTKIGQTIVISVEPPAAEYQPDEPEQTV